MKKMLIGIIGVLMLVGGVVVGDGTAQTTYTISGRVIDSRQAIGGIGGVTMTGLPGNPTTDGTGHYSGIVPSNWSGTVKPQKTGYAIFPFFTEYTTITSDQSQNYTAVLLPKVALFMQQATYNLGDPINIVMTLQNQGNDFFTTQGFMATNFALFLQFTDPDGKLITSNLGTGHTPLPPPLVPITTPEGKVELLQVEYVETVPANWVLSMPFNALDFYTLTKGGNYSVKAKLNMRAYLPNSVSQTNPKYALHDSGSSGDVESNIINFALSTKANQTITFPALPIKTYGDADFNLAATASSGLPVSYTSSNPAVATIVSGKIHIVGVGTSMITASQGGNTNYNAAADVSQSLTVAKANQTITFNAPPNKAYGDPPFTVSASASSGLTVSFSILSGPATISGNIVTITGAGTVTVRGSQVGNANYNPAPSADRSFQVSYVYAGFFSPVDNPPAVNTANAGQAIPVKWRLTDANGVGISDTGSFISLTSCKSNCTDWKCIEDPVRESAAGASGLQFLGNGNWQFNWKTPKTYAGTCRILMLNLNDGSQHKAEFKFK